MSIASGARQLSTLESLSEGTSPIHRLHPLAKVGMAGVFIVCVASFGPYSVTRLAPYAFYPFVAMALSGLAYRPLLARAAVALPFCLALGLSNLALERTPALYVGGFALTYGMLSLAVILLKTYLCVMAALMLAATTRFADLAYALRRLHIPPVFVSVFEMTFRYIGTLLEEALGMSTAYSLRSCGKAGIDMRHMGSFLGYITLRSFERAQRIYDAMACRGYSAETPRAYSAPFRRRDGLALACVAVPAIALRFFSLPW